MIMKHSCDDISYHEGKTTSIFFVKHCSVYFFSTTFKKWYTLQKQAKKTQQASKQAFYCYHFEGH